MTMMVVVVWWIVIRMHKTQYCCPSTNAFLLFFISFPIPTHNLILFKYKIQMSIHSNSSLESESARKINKSKFVNLRSKNHCNGSNTSYCVARKLFRTNEMWKKKWLMSLFWLPRKRRKLLFQFISPSTAVYKKIIEWNFPLKYLFMEKRVRRRDKKQLLEKVMENQKFNLSSKEDHDSINLYSKV